MLASLSGLQETVNHKGRSGLNGLVEEVPQHAKESRSPPLSFAGMNATIRSLNWKGSKSPSNSKNPRGQKGGSKPLK